ncbi:MAG: hypothetical protein NVS3B24_04060 [Candidatus Dormibacteria bacterium]
MATGTVNRPRRRQPRSSTKAQLVVVTVALLAGLGVQGVRLWSVSQARASLESYSTAIHTPLHRGGFIVQEGLKPELADFSAGKLGTAQFARDGAAFASDLTAVKVAFDRVPEPAGLAGSRADFDRALDAYIALARSFSGVPAAAVPGDEMTRIAAAGNTADQLFDRAARRLQAARSALRLAPDPNLPHPLGGQ